ncbi:MAG: galactokinase [Anaerolineales bacterium]|nr:galactokinase [Anaerolineales bacterium]MCS7247016.1 galactokinase [Anaerolineales bacterium]MDW8160827.1 galactokinase [Anaerolineales bacterium]MDW8446817.1 galactokinase [Anaerolineales bacterium]
MAVTSAIELTQRFVEHFQARPQILARAPGRVNVLGEHVDYNEGVVLPMAIDREVGVVARETALGEFHIVALDLGEEVVFTEQSILEKRDKMGNPLPRWALYPAGVAWILSQQQLRVSSIQAVFSSSVPIGAGLSSSAAVEVAFAMVWSGLGEWKLPPLDLAQFCQRAENEYVGVACGLLDQFSSVCGVEKHLLFFDTRSLEWQPLQFFEDCVIVIADSGIRRSLASSEYNRRRETCEEAVRYLQRYLPNLKSLRDISPVEFAAYREFLPLEAQRRAEHVVKEIARVFSAVNALKNRDRRAFGALMYASHYSLRDDYEVSHPNLDALVEIAKQLPGCYGARLTGAGFGGCTVNMVAVDAVEQFVEQLDRLYFEHTGIRGKFFAVKASQGASFARITG